MRTTTENSIAAARLEAAPIEPSWIVAGEPRARCALLNQSRDRTAITLVWDCTAGEFDWTYVDDETVHILEGEVVLDDGSGQRRVGPGDVVLFHAGSTWRWQVPVYVKKVAFLRVPLPRPAVLAVRAWRRLRGLVSLRAAAKGLATFGCLVNLWAWQLGASLADGGVPALG